MDTYAQGCVELHNIMFINDNVNVIIKFSYTDKTKNILTK